MAPVVYNRQWQYCLNAVSGIPMKRTSLFIAAVYAALLGLGLTATSAVAKDYKLDCQVAEIWTAISRDNNGTPLLNVEPDNVSASCDKSRKADVYVLRGFPGEYASPKAVLAEIQGHVKLLESPSMKDIPLVSLPLPMQFVKKLLIEKETAEEKRRQATATKPTDGARRD